MKDSGVEWIGKIPENWGTRRLKAIATIANGATPESGEPDYWDGNIKWATPEDLSLIQGRFISDTRRKITKKGYESCAAKIVPNQSIVISTRAPIGLLAESTDSMCFNQGCRGLVPSNGFDTGFLYYYVLMSQTTLDSFGTGSTFKELSRKNLADFQIPYPPHDQQKRVSHFLDSKTALIDRVIGQKRKLIDLLKEKRTAIINRAVTRGLDENVELVDSGVEWIGRVPKGWRVEKIKYIAPVRDQKTENSKGRDYVGLENIESETGKFIESETPPEPESIVNAYEKNDLLFCKLRPYLAKVLRANKSGVCTSELLVLKVDANKLSQDFLYYRLLSRDFLALVNNSTYGAKMPRASWNFIGNVFIPIPNISEQMRIVAELRALDENINQAIQKIEHGVRLLTEYRASMISHVVTGKVEV